MKKYIKAAENISSMAEYVDKLNQIMADLNVAKSDLEARISLIYDTINQFYKDLPDGKQSPEFVIDNPDNYPWFMSISDEDADALYDMWDKFYSQNVEYEALVDGIVEASEALDEAYNRIADLND